jgi:hypothetical protein
MSSRFIHLALLLAMSVALPGSALAATAPAGENITASPTQIKPQLQPGTTTGGSITIINDGTKPYDFKGYVTPYHVAGENYDPSFTTEAGQDQAPVSQPHQTIVIPYTIAVPAGTGGGGYYATLFFETIPKTSPGSGVTSKQRVGIVAYIKVEGDTIEHGSVESFTIPPINPGPPVVATLRLKNDGNVHYTADITEHVTDVFGRPKATIHVIREVLPQTTRRFELSWDKAPAFGLFHVDASVQMLGRTEVLRARYILILSAGAFVAVAAMLLLLLGLFVWWRIGRKR